MNKFKNLTKYLKDRSEDIIKMSFANLEKVIGFSLPDSAYKHRAYFANVLGHSISKAWMEAGYRATNIDIYNRTLDFVKESHFQNTLLSSYIFANLHNYKYLLKGNVYLSGIAFCESIFLFGLDYDDACKRLSEYNIHLVDNKLQSIDINSPFVALNNAKSYCLNIYNKFIRITILRCLISVFHNHSDRQCVLGALMEDHNLKFDFPYSLENDLNISVFAIKLKAIISKTTLNKTYNQIVDMIGMLEYKSVESIPSNLSFTEDNYLNDMCKLFIQSCKEKEPFIGAGHVSELFNVQIMFENKNLLYITADPLNNRILRGNILEKITLVGRR